MVGRESNTDVYNFSIKNNPMKNTIRITLACLVLMSCGHSKMEVVQEKPLVDISIVSNETDPVCNMPVKGNLSDTALIDNKVWGFCSSSCKEKYLHSK